MAEQDFFVFNGVDKETGELWAPPLVDASERVVLKALPPWIDRNDLAQCGWGLVLAKNDPQAALIREALSPLDRASARKRQRQRRPVGIRAEHGRPGLPPALQEPLHRGQCQAGALLPADRRRSPLHSVFLPIGPGGFPSGGPPQFFADRTIFALCQSGGGGGKAAQLRPAGGVVGSRPFGRPSFPADHPGAHRAGRRSVAVQPAGFCGRQLPGSSATKKT